MPYHFSVLRTKRLTIQLKELSIANSIALATMPANQEQAETTAFLKYAIDKVETKDETLKDPRNWTVQERVFAVCHYLASTDEKTPDFEVGGGHFSDYLQAEKDYAADSVEVCELEGDRWNAVHLTGLLAESIERLLGEPLNEGENPPPARLHWMLGVMAAQLRREGDPDPFYGLTEGDIDAKMLERMRVFAAFPESDFVVLVYQLAAAREKLAHLFDIETGTDGIVCLPKQDAKGADGAVLPPARFPISACLSRFAQAMAR